MRAAEKIPVKNRYVKFKLPSLKLNSGDYNLFILVPQECHREKIIS